MCVLSQKGLHRPCFTATSAQTPGFTHMARQMCLAYVQGWKMKNYGSEGPRALKGGGREGGNFSSAEKSSCGCEAGGRRLTGGRAASLVHVGPVLKGATVTPAPAGPQQAFHAWA